MNCSDARTGYLDGDDRVFDSHAKGCVECRDLRPELHSMRLALADEAVWKDPSRDLADRVVAAVALSDEPRHWGRWLLPALVGAAAVVVAIGLAASLVRSGPDWEIRVAQTAPELDGTIAGWNDPVGTRVVVNVDGLKPVPGFMYELWFSSDTVAISAGTFVTGNGVDLTVGVARVDYPRVWITLEPTNGGPLPEGDLIYDVITTG